MLKYSSSILLMVWMMAVACSDSTPPASNESKKDVASSDVVASNRAATTANSDQELATLKAELASAQKQNELKQQELDAQKLAAAMNTAGKTVVTESVTAPTTITKEETQSLLADNSNLNLGIEKYASSLFGYNSVIPNVTNTNWSNQLSQDYNYYQGLCANGSTSCPVPQFDMFANTGDQLGVTYFEQFYQKDKSFLGCKGSFDQYWNGFIQGSWLNDIKIVINVQVFVNGRLYTQENFNENSYAPVLIYRLMQKFKEKYEQYVNGGMCQPTAPVVQCPNSICSQPKVPVFSCVKPMLVPVFCQTNHCLNQFPKQDYAVWYNDKYGHNVNRNHPYAQMIDQYRDYDGREDLPTSDQPASTETNSEQNVTIIGDNNHVQMSSAWNVVVGEQESRRKRR